MAAPLDIDQLQTFIAIIDSGSFTKAADRVYKTQSAVSMQMRRLEERIGKQLFIKDGRGNRMTVEGEKLLNYARRIIRLNNEAIAAFDDNRLEGTLRIGTPDDYADRYMPEIIGRFRQDASECRALHRLRAFGGPCRAMHRGELDIALVTHNPRERMSDVVEPSRSAGSVRPTIRSATTHRCRWPSGVATARGGRCRARRSMRSAASTRSCSPAGRAPSSPLRFSPASPSR
jgi:DNA-binding transcriptional LysR family regulator